MKRRKRNRQETIEIMRFKSKACYRFNKVYGKHRTLYNTFPYCLMSSGQKQLMMLAFTNQMLDLTEDWDLDDTVTGNIATRMDDALGGLIMDEMDFM